MRTLAVAAVVTDVSVGDLDANLAAVAAGLRRGFERGASLVVLTELATSGYVFRDREEAESVALSSGDPRLVGLREHVPDGTVAVVGFCEAAGGNLFNSAAVITSDGVVGVYRKSHLWDREKTIFTPGPSAGLVLETPIGRLGVAICYDNEFPEVPRGLALAGAEILALPVNWPLVPRPDGEHAPEIVQAMAAARSSRLPTVVADRHGVERGVEWTAGTAVISGDGWIVARPDAADPVVAAELELVGHTVLGEFNDLFGDRRPDLYHPGSTPLSLDH